MKLRYFGHSMWKVITEQLSVVIDPFDNIGYPMPVGLTADVVIISHEHHDHNNAALVQGNPRVFRQAGVYQVGNIRVELLQTFHDNDSGAKRGINYMTVISADGLKLVHCGDLGHLPDKETLRHIGKPDILLVPVGEVYTLSLDNVLALLEALQPTLVFPMHYRTPAIGFKLGELSAFLYYFPDYIQHQGNCIDIDSALLSQKSTIVMKPSA